MLPLTTVSIISPALPRAEEELTVPLVVSMFPVSPALISICPPSPAPLELVLTVAVWIVPLVVVASVLRLTSPPVALVEPEVIDPTVVSIAPALPVTSRVISPLCPSQY